MQLWLQEPMHDQPYHNIGAVADSVASVGEYVEKGDSVKSTQAVAGSDKGHEVKDKGV